MPVDALTGAPFSSNGKTLRTESHPLVDAHTIADNTGLSYNHTGSVVDEKASSDLRARMNVDPGSTVGVLTDNARNNGHAQLIQLMGNAMVRDGKNSG